jgi:hypothetical protein
VRAYKIIHDVLSSLPLSGAVRKIVYFILNYKGISDVRMQKWDAIPNIHNTNFGVLL